MLVIVLRKKEFLANVQNIKKNTNAKLWSCSCTYSRANLKLPLNIRMRRAASR